MKKKKLMQFSAGVMAAMMLVPNTAGTVNASELSSTESIGTGTEAVTVADEPVLEDGEVTAAGAISGVVPCSFGSVTWSLDTSTDEYKLFISGNGTVSVSDWESFWTSNLGSYKTQVRYVKVEATENVKLTTCKSMFAGFSNMKGLYLNGVDTTSVTDFSSMMSGCSAMTTVNLSSVSMAEGAKVADMWKNCNVIAKFQTPVGIVPMPQAYISNTNGCGYVWVDTANAKSYSGVSGTTELFNTSCILVPAQTYTITFTVQNHSVTASKTVSNAEPVDLTSASYDETTDFSEFNAYANMQGYGYTWYKDSSYATKLPSIAIGNTSDISVYGIQHAYNYKINYMDVPDTSSLPATFNRKSAASLPSAVTRTGYSFEGWYLDAAYTNPVASITTSAVGYNDVNVYAKWSINTYTIRYELDGGENASDNPSTYTVESDDITLAAPPRDYYTFGGWYTDKACTQAVSGIPNGSAGGVTLYAKWTPVEYNIHYEVNGGTNSTANHLSYNVESDEIVFAEPERLGYTFLGWYSDQACTQAVSGIPAGSNGDVTVYARWKINTYTIAYDLAGGKNNTNPATYTVETEDIALTSPEKDYYIFAGWYADADYTEKVTGIPTGSTGDVSLFAKWEAEVYPIAYELNGGINSTENPDFVTVETGEITLAEPTRRGYSFVGWYSDQACTRKVTSVTYVGKKANETTTVYAKWKINTYGITYELNGGINSKSNPAAYTVETEDITFAEPSKKGYDFAGWYLDADCTQAVTGIPMGSTGDVTVYAKWTPTLYTITYNLNGGDETDNETVYTIESEDISFTESTRTGYTFGGWYADEACTQAVTSIPTGSTGDIVLYAKWDAIAYNINYKLNGGTNSQENPADYTIESEDILFAAPEKTGYDFAGWYLDADCTEEVTGIPAGSIEEITVYAAWTPTRYTISYELNGGSETDNETVYTIESDEITFEESTRTGYTFGGWYADEKFKNEVTGIPTGSTGNRTLYAKWVADKYTINYELNGGTNNAKNPAVYTIEDSVSYQAPERAGYTFGGWYADAAFTTAAEDIPAGSMGEVTVYAKWQIAFTDIDNTPGTWRYDSAEYMCERGLMSGKTSDKGTTFNPKDTLSRGMLVTILYRMAGSPEVEYEAKFADVASGKYYSKAVIWASENGLATGTSKTKFSPNDPVTREQMAKMLYQYAKLQGYDVTGSTDISTYPDASKTSKWGVKYMEWAVAEGLITGKAQKGKVFLDAKGDATRVECAAILMRFMENYNVEE